MARNGAYENVSETDLDVHVYGVMNWRPTRELDVTMHGVKKPDFEYSWFVMYQPPPDRPEHGAALLAVETGPAKWEGFWTDDPALIDELTTYVRANL